MDDRAPSAPVPIRRGFADIAGGQVHYRVAGTALPGTAPLVMLHASPGSSLMLLEPIRRFARTRRVVALDTLGNGDSSPPREAAPGIEAFAAAHLEALTALGIERFDLYGSHTGGSIACEMAIAAPDRVRRIVLDGMSLYSAAEREGMLRTYAPALTPDAHAGHLMWIWHFVRDAFLFWPYYERDAAHRRDGVGLPGPEALHDKFVEVAKAARTYHLSYRAGIGYDKAARVPLVTQPVLLACARDDMLLPYLDAVAALLPGAERAVTPGFGSDAAADGTLARMLAFLDGPPAAGVAEAAAGRDGRQAT